MCGYLPTLVLFLLALTGRADTKSSVARLEVRYRTPKKLEASFLERYTENGRFVRVEAGTVYFKRPGKMRWDYQAPERNLFLVDGKTAWFYVPADHTATRVPAKESTDWRTPLALLAGEMKISRVCASIEIALNEKPITPDHAVLYCELRSVQAKPDKQRSKEDWLQSGKGSEAVFFEVAKESGELVRVLVRDPGGIEMEFRFTNWQIDPPVDDSLFRFHAPSGVAIVKGELADGNRGINP